MGADTLGRVGPNAVVASPILPDPPLSGKGPSMSAATVLAFPVASKATDPDEVNSWVARGYNVGAVTEAAVAVSAGPDIGKTGTDYARAFRSLLDALRVK